MEGEADWVGEGAGLPLGAALGDCEAGAEGEAGAEPLPRAEAEPLPEPVAAAERDAVAEAEPVAVAEALPDAVAEAEPDAVAEPLPVAEGLGEALPEGGAEAEALPEPEPAGLPAALGVGEAGPEGEARAEGEGWEEKEAVTDMSGAATVGEGGGAPATMVTMRGSVPSSVASSGTREGLPASTPAVALKLVAGSAAATRAASAPGAATVMFTPRTPCVLGTPLFSSRRPRSWREGWQAPTSFMGSRGEMGMAAPPAVV